MTFDSFGSISKNGFKIKTDGINDLHCMPLLFKKKSAFIELHYSYSIHRYFCILKLKQTKNAMKNINVNFGTQKCIAKNKMHSLFVVGPAKTSLLLRPGMCVSEREKERECVSVCVRMNRWRGRLLVPHFISHVLCCSIHNHTNTHTLFTSCTYIKPKLYIVHPLVCTLQQNTPIYAVKISKVNLTYHLSIYLCT